MTKYSHAGSMPFGPAQAVRRCCPSCNSTYLDRVPRRFIDRVICLVVPLRRYHCESCGWRGNLITR